MLHKSQTSKLKKGVRGGSGGSVEGEVGKEVVGTDREAAGAEASAAPPQLASEAKT